MYIRGDKSVCTYLLLYVDDILLAGEKNIVLSVVKTLSKEFKMQKENTGTFLGMKINRDEEKHVLKLDQSKYIKDLLVRLDMYDCKPCKTPLEVNFKIVTDHKSTRTNKPYREAVGCLMYMMTHTRPDISFAVNILSRYQSNASDVHWSLVKRVLRYLKGTENLCLEYSVKNTCDIIVGYCDADFAGDTEQRKSTTGYIFQLFGSTIAWSSRKQSTVALSTTEAEYIALASTVSECLWIRSMLDEMQILNLAVPTPIYEDNQSCITITKEPRKHQRLKHIDVKYCFVKEACDNGNILIKYIPTTDQIADIFTKSLPLNIFQKFVSFISLLLMNI